MPILRTYRQGIFTILLDIRLIFANNGSMAITRRQREVYDFISRFVAEHQYSPSFEEIGEGLELNSLATVHKHITNLEKKGLLTRDYNRSRSIDLLPPKGRLKQAMSVNTGLVLPLVGRIAAGMPIEKCLCSKCGGIPCRRKRSSMATTCWWRS
jgi:repressor LexA